MAKPLEFHIFTFLKNKKKFKLKKKVKIKIFF